MGRCLQRCPWRHGFTGKGPALTLKEVKGIHMSNADKTGCLGLIAAIFGIDLASEFLDDLAGP